MAYSNYYYLHAARRVQQTAAPYLDAGRSMYWIWQNVQLPIFPMSYTSFVSMMSESRLEARIAHKEKGRNRRYCIKNNL